MSPGDPAATMDSLNDSITEKATESAPDIPLADARTESAENEANFMSKLMFQWISHFVIVCLTHGIQVWSTDVSF